MCSLIITAQLCAIGLLMLKGILFSLVDSEPIFFRWMIWFIAQKNDHSGIKAWASTGISCLLRVCWLYELCFWSFQWWFLLSLCWSGEKSVWLPESFYHFSCRNAPDVRREDTGLVLRPCWYSAGLQMLGCIICQYTFALKKINFLLWLVSL